MPFNIFIFFHSLIVAILMQCGLQVKNITGVTGMAIIRSIGSRMIWHVKESGYDFSR